MAVSFTEAAARDLDDIWYAIGQDSVSAADRMIDAIRQKSAQLAAFPESGRTRPDIAPDARSLVVGPYIMLYRVAGPDAVVVRIIHGARNQSDLL